MIITKHVESIKTVEKFTKVRKGTMLIVPPNPNPKYSYTGNSTIEILSVVDNVVLGKIDYVDTLSDSTELVTIIIDDKMLRVTIYGNSYDVTTEFMLELNDLVIKDSMFHSVKESNITETKLISVEVNDEVISDDNTIYKVIAVTNEKVVLFNDNTSTVVEVTSDDNNYIVMN